MALVAKRVFKACQIVKHWWRSTITQARLSIIWDFEGRASFAGRVYTRAVSGDVQIGPNVRFGPDVTIDCSGGALLQIGQGTTVNQGCVITAMECVKIGRDVSIGDFVSIRDNDHEWRDAERRIRDQGYVTATVTIGDDVWIGRGVMIGKGVSVGEGAVIGANSVVVKDVPSYSVVAGVPARVIKRRGD